MNTYGHIIKFERIRQNIKQIDLSKRICTPSYLSKIESNLIVPSEEIIVGLFKRLNIEHYSSRLSEDGYIKCVRLKYIEAIKYKDKILISKYLDELLEKKYLFSSPSNFYTYIMIIIRLKTMVYNFNNDSSPLIKSISRFTDDFSSYQLFLYHTCLGYHYYYQMELDNSLQSLEKAKIFQNQCELEECELADFHYVLGTIYLQQQRLILSLDYSSKAQLYFNKEFLHNRTIETYIITAVAYKRSSDSEKNYQHLKLAEKIALKSDITENLGSIYLNIASYFSLKKDYEKAIDYYIKSLNVSQSNELKLINIYCIVAQYSMMQNYKEVIDWSKKGIALFELEPDELSQGIFYRLQIHLSIHNNYQDFEDIVRNALEYFAQIKDFRLSHKYALLLGNYFYHNGTYKKATATYAMANKYLSQKENRQYLEDL